MAEPTNKILHIPVELASYVIRHRLMKAFSVFVYLKCYTSGIINKDSVTFKALGSTIGVKDNRTLNKYLKQIIGLNWIGYNTVSGNYFIRSIDKIRVLHNFKKRQAVTFNVKDLRQIQGFCIASVIGGDINKHKYFKEVVLKRIDKFAAVKSGAALQNFLSSPTSYYGKSLKGLSKVLGCSQTTACELKQKAIKAGFLKAKHHFVRLRLLEKRDYRIRHILTESYPQLKGKIRFRKKIIKDKKTNTKKAFVEVVAQLHDELIPQVKFKKIDRFSKINIAA